jgi:hypothetical protein
MYAEYRVYFSATFAPTWTKKNFNTKPVSISPYAETVSSSDALVMYSKDIDRLYEGMRTFGGKVQLSNESVIRYEYWVTEDNPTAAWSLNNPYGMKYAGFKKWWEGNHRIVICRKGLHRPKRSRIILRPFERIQGLYPDDYNIADLVDEIKKNAAKPEKGEGAGDAAEMAVTDGLVPILKMFVGGE